VVCVHGIGKQLDGEDSLAQSWLPALTDGLRRAGHAGLVDPSDVAVAFYGDLFRPAGRLLAVGDPAYTADDVEPGFEQELLLAWWSEAARTDPSVVPPEACDTLASTPRAVQSALRALSGSKFFADVALRAMVADLKQVRGYLLDPRIRSSVRARVRDAIRPDTRVVVAHSLGSVVAYEVLCALGTHRINALVTLGSPLGIPNLVFDRLDPTPVRWPGPAETLTWTNLAADGDAVALVKDLRPLFGPRLRSAIVHTGSHAHDAVSYLTDPLCGDAVAAGLK
jgi:hypothetical protein